MNPQEHLSKQLHKLKPWHVWVAIFFATCVAIILAIQFGDLIFSSEKKGIELTYYAIQSLAGIAQIIVLGLIFKQIKAQSDATKSAAFMSVLTKRVDLVAQLSGTYGDRYDKLVEALKVGSSFENKSFSEEVERRLRDYWSFQWLEFDLYLQGVVSISRYKCYLKFRMQEWDTFHFSNMVSSTDNDKHNEYKKLVKKTVEAFGDDRFKQLIIDEIFKPRNNTASEKQMDGAIALLNRFCREHWQKNGLGFNDLQGWIKLLSQQESD